LDWSLTFEITIPLFSVGLIASLLITIYRKGRSFYFELERYTEIIIELIVYAQDKGKIELINSRNDLKQQLLIDRKKRFFKYGYKILIKSKARHKIAYEFFTNFIIKNIISEDVFNSQLSIWIILNFMIKYKGNSTQFKNLYDAFIDDFNNKKDQYELSIDQIDERSLELFREIPLPDKDNETLIQSFKRNKAIEEIKFIISNEEKYKENVLLRNYVEEVRILINQLEIDSKNIINIIQQEKYSILYFDYFSSHASQFIKSALERNHFTKIYRLTAHIRLLPNYELKKYNYNLQNWLKNNFERDFEEIHQKGGGFFFLIRFETQNFQELKFNLEFEPKLLFNSLKQQITNNDNLFLKLLDLSEIHSNSELKKLYPIDFLQIPRAFINCSLNRNYRDKDFDKILHDKNLISIIHKSEDFTKISEEKLRESFSLPKDEYEQLMKSLKILKIIKDGCLENFLNSD